MLVFFGSRRWLWVTFLILTGLPSAASAQNPIDIPLEDQPANTFSNGQNEPLWSGPQASSSPQGFAVRSSVSGQLGLRLTGSGLGLQGMLMQRLLPFVSLAEAFQYQRLPTDSEPSHQTESEWKASLGFHIAPEFNYLFSPFVHLKGGYQTWLGLNETEGQGFVGHDLGLVIKLTQNFWLSLVKRDTYFGKPPRKLALAQPINDRHYSSSEAYFTFAF